MKKFISKRKIVNALIVSIVFCFNIKAQVTIGLDEKPIGGALLDLKEKTADPVDNSTANKGLLLPRVKLIDPYKLYPMFLPGYDETVQHAKHTGLLVWNINASLGVGVWTWTGSEWMSLLSPTPGSVAPTIINVTDGSTCGSNSVTLSATADVGEVRWYDLENGGTLLHTGTTYQPTITSTTEYWVGAYDSSTGLTSATRTKVTATFISAVSVNNQPSDISQTTGTSTVISLSITPSGGKGSYTYKWYYSTSATGGTVTQTSTTTGTAVINGATVSDYYWWCEVSDGCSTAKWPGRVRVTVSNPAPSAPAVTEGNTCGSGTVNLSATTSGGAVVRWYNAGGSLLGTTNSGATWTTPSISSSTTYYAEAYDKTTGLASSKIPVLATVNTRPTISNPAGGRRTGTGTVNLSATASNGAVVRWYDVNTGGTALGTSNSGATWTTPSISSTTTYYAEAYNNTTKCVSSSRTAVTATVATATPPAAPSSPKHGTFCSPSGTTNLSATVGAGEVVDWYDSPTGGQKVGTSNSGANWTTPTLSQDVDYYAEARNTSTNAVSTTRIRVQAIVINYCWAQSLPCAGYTYSFSSMLNKDQWTKAIAFNTPCQMDMQLNISHDTNIRVEITQIDASGNAGTTVKDYLPWYTNQYQSLPKSYFGMTTVVRIMYLGPNASTGINWNLKLIK